jgi:hypothetical protein
MEVRYLFLVHRRSPRWRLVLRKGAVAPALYVAEDWIFSRERSADDTNADVRRACDEAGYCLFKIGVTFEEFTSEVGAP